jgi:hypothetical protein
MIIVTGGRYLYLESVHNVDTLWTDSIWTTGNKFFGSTWAERVPDVEAYMYREIGEQTRIEEYQNIFWQSLTNGAERAALHFSFRFTGRRPESDNFWSPGLGLCMGTRRAGKASKLRYWNAFGLQPVRPAPGKGIPVTVEINFPLAEIDRRIAGIFLEDRDGKIFVAHRGNITCGRTINIFAAGYRGPSIIIPGQGRAALVGELRSSEFPQRVRDFVREIDRIKAGAR